MVHPLVFLPNSLPRTLLVLAVATASPFANSNTASADVMSEFNSGDEGWTLSGDSSSGSATFLGTGGNPGGFIRGNDSVASGVWYFEAPAKFLGNQSSSYGGSLTYELRQRPTGSNVVFSAHDILLEGTSETLRLLNTPPVPQNVVWTSYSATLLESSDWSLSGGGTPTQAQFQGVLGNLQRLRIRGEFITGGDSGDLDNVVLSTASAGPVPEPTSFAVMAGALFLWRFRRKSRHRVGTHHRIAEK